jgi:putative flippase GtrA
LLILINSYYIFIKFKSRLFMIKFVKFFLAWILTYWINVWLTFVLVSFFLFSKEIAYFISIFLITIINFIISLKFTFKNNYSHSIFVKYLVILLIFSILNYILVVLIKNHLRTNFYVIISIVTTLIFFLKFVAYDRYVFWKCEKTKTRKCEIEEI